MTSPVALIGMGTGPQDLTPAQRQRIDQANILIGGQRHLDAFDAHPAAKRAITRDLEGLFDFIKKTIAKDAAKARIVILASGDPLFYGIGARLIAAVGPDNVAVYPNITAVAAAFARIKMPWQDAAVVSLHGRDHTADLLQALNHSAQIAVFTDPRHTPAYLAELLERNDQDQVQMIILEKMGGKAEKITHGTPTEIRTMQAAEPNLVILLNPAENQKPRPALHPGMPDSAFAHENGLITKAEIRAVTLAKLALQPDQVLWDLGAGSGSIGIEASVLLGRGRIFAVEKNKTRLKQIEQNKKRFGVHQLQVIEARLPRGLEDLPAPDRVFIGGGGKDIDAIMRTAARRLPPDGRMVVNTVVIENMNRVLRAFTDLGFTTDVVQLQVSRGKPMPSGQRLAAENPVWIIAGWKLEIQP